MQSKTGQKVATLDKRLIFPVRSVNLPDKSSLTRFLHTIKPTVKIIFQCLECADMYRFIKYAQSKQEFC